MNDLLGLISKNDEFAKLIFEKHFTINDLVKTEVVIPNYDYEIDLLFFRVHRDKIDWSKVAIDLPLTENFINEFNDEILNERNITSKEKGVLFSRNTKIIWTKKLICKYEDVIDWEDLVVNPAVPWGKELYLKFKDRIHITWGLNGGLLNNKGIRWTEDFIEAIIDHCEKEHLKKAYFDELIRKCKVKFSIEFLIKFYDYINLKDALWHRVLVVGYEDLMKNKSKIATKNLFNNIITYSGLTWDASSIKLFEDIINFSLLSSASNVEWNENLLRAYADKWNFAELSGNNSFCWSTKLFEEYVDKWDIKRISHLRTFPWTPELLEKYIDNIDLNAIINNSEVFIPGDFIHKYRHRISWKGKTIYGSNTRYYYSAAGISQNTNIEIHANTLVEMTGEWEIGSRIYIAWSEANEELPGEWHLFSNNKYLNANHLNIFKKKLSWDVVSQNLHLQLNDDLLAKFTEYWDWGILSQRKDLNWTIDLLVKFSSYWKWHLLLVNETVLEKIILPNLNSIKLYFIFTKYEKNFANFVNTGGWYKLKSL